MNFIKKNIWNLFNIIVIISLFVAVVIAYTLWHQSYDKQKIE